MRKNKFKRKFKSAINTLPGFGGDKLAYRGENEANQLRNLLTDNFLSHDTIREVADDNASIPSNRRIRNFLFQIAQEQERNWKGCVRVLCV